VEVNAYQERWLRGIDKDIVAKGGKPIDIHAYTTATDVLAALNAGQIEIAILIDQTAREMVKRGFVRIEADGLGGAPTTLVFRNKTVAAAAADALNAMRADGFYDALFDKYGLTRFPKEPFAIRGPGPG
jgi:polar amino acid transport system substrate-binding protein